MKRRFAISSDFSRMTATVVVSSPLHVSHSLTADEPQRARLSIPTYCNVAIVPVWSRRIFSCLSPVLAYTTIFQSRCKFSTLTSRQPMVEFYLLAFFHHGGKD